jgi:exodeoxyribonuclease VII large subunit
VQRTQNNLEASQVLSVSDLNRQARLVIEDRFREVCVMGEMSNFARPRSGHWYFTLKDEAAQVRCAMFVNRNRAVQMQPGDGQLVLIRGRVSLYEGRGEFQVIVDSMEAAGEGALRQAFDQLKVKLSAEGLFSPAHKQSLPDYPERLAVVTSATGAAFRDVRAVLARRYPNLTVLLIPCLVQGDQAEGDLLRALDEATRCHPDVILLTRGGGSLEDLWAFNSERLARAIHGCPIPTVAAIGHEIDITIADYVADLRAPTPSAAAELISPDRIDLIAEFTQYERHLLTMFRSYLDHQQLRVENVALKISDPKAMLAQQQQRILDLVQRLARDNQHALRNLKDRARQLEERLQRQAPSNQIEASRGNLKALQTDLARAIRGRLEAMTLHLGQQSRMLNGLSPLPTLDRGYALIKDQAGKVVSSTQDVHDDDEIRIFVADGSLSAKVTDTDNARLTGREP